ncbi:MAG: hypothetical protein ACJ76W_10255, partial [Chloroflexota bacterium]
ELGGQAARTRDSDARAADAAGHLLRAPPRGTRRGDDWRSTRYVPVNGQRSGGEAASGILTR